MNCDCIKKVEQKVLDMKEWKRKKILSASMQSFWATEPKFERYTSSDVTVSLEGQKKEEKIAIQHSYCPFCGKKTVNAAESKKELNPAPG